MTKSLLIVTPQTSFGTMLRSSLEESGQFHVFIAGDEPTAIIQLKSEDCELAFLDVDLGMEAVLEIGRALRTVHADVELVIVSDEELPPALDALRPWMLLRKPFYLPELMEMLSVTSEDNTPGPIIELPAEISMTENAELLWLQDVNKAAQRLTRLTLESSAQAALITRGRSLWAYAGGLSQETANELVRIVSRNWDEQKGGDLLRFARLETTKAEHMLYATTLAEGVVLALVFDAETPFSTIRSQANSLARSLAVEKTGPVKPFVVEPAPKSRTSGPVPTNESDLDLPSISAIINDIPTPIPAPQPALRMEAAAPPTLDVKQTKLDHSALETRPSTPLAETRVVSRESSPPVPLRDLMFDETVKHEYDETVKHELDELDVTAPSKVQRPPTPVRPPQPGILDETRPHSITEVAGRVILEPASPGLYHLNYACLLVPRFSSHYLTGDLAARLGEWLPNICVAFGWRLEFQAVRPEYMQWVVSVPPNTSPGYLMRIMRQQTSEKIFAEFPRLKKENPSGDFWAPGYLIMGGTQPHPQQLVKDYIKQTRDRQGISQPRK
jgi:REP element-mobilizing transposase RayT/DNA-binding response OmpR family regulator